MRIFLEIIKNNQTNILKELENNPPKSYKDFFKYCIESIYKYSSTFSQESEDLPDPNGVLSTQFGRYYTDILFIIPGTGLYPALYICQVGYNESGGLIEFENSVDINDLYCLLERMATSIKKIDFEYIEMLWKNEWIEFDETYKNE